MKVKDILKEFESYDPDMDVRVFLKCKNASMGIDQILNYNKDVMIYLNSDDEKTLFNVAP